MKLHLIYLTVLITTVLRATEPVGTEYDAVSALWRIVQMEVEYGDPSMEDSLKRYQSENKLSDAKMGDLTYELFMRAMGAQAKVDQRRYVDLISLPATAGRFYKNEKFLKELEQHIESGTHPEHQRGFLLAYIYQSSVKLDGIVERALGEAQDGSGYKYSIYENILNCLRKDPAASTPDKIKKLKDWANQENESACLSILDAYIVSMDPDYAVTPARIANLNRVITRFENAGIPLRAYYKTEMEKIRPRQTPPWNATNASPRIESITPPQNEIGETNNLAVTIPRLVLPTESESLPTKSHGLSRLWWTVAGALLLIPVLRFLIRRRK